eukprot:CAMPEP_0184506226 /NCGR_PEP_ID=MMETSP0113_2-20130426/53389_1 /TAXON_ID=91329 /ORGANISM="Norrisiella sphaerica, Strain BC52" /LENGTH=560 /DNA_ID=CAMNT_0026895935 /DNA_START=300 /DNA_END=1979 /DNA_ORIENTATION=+
MALMAAAISTVCGLMDQQETIPGRTLLEEESSELQNYPKDLFTIEQRKNGAFVLHLIGACYMFVALALVCDEFFVPSLEVITEKLGWSDDVAGATFLAAGGSAPELATSFMGTFISKSDVGFGTIVGSAVFNILFVIGACAWFSAVELQLTWWPLFRDTVYYCIALAVLSALFFDKEIQTFEAVTMFALYFCYVLLMSQNPKVEACFKGTLQKCGCLANKVHPEVEDDEGSKAEKGGGGGLDESKSDLGHRATQMSRTTTMHYKLHRHFQASAKSRNKLLPLEPRSPLPHPHPLQPPTPSQGAGSNIMSPIGDVNKGIDSSYAPSPMHGGERHKVDKALVANGDSKQAASHQTSHQTSHQAPATQSGENSKVAAEEGAADEGGGDEEDEDDDPMDLAFPHSCHKRVTYILLAPLTYSLFYTIPDVRREGYRNLYVLSFFMSVSWIGVFSFLMVWWITVVGDSLGIPSAIMGLTILAIGTSVPDLLESIIVAKQGKGDMAVSSSLGSNIFDITVGLPVPWLLYTLIYGESIQVGTEGLFVSVIMLFVMLACCVSVVALNKW